MKHIQQILSDLSLKLPADNNQLIDLIDKYPASSILRIGALKKYKDEHSSEFDRIKLSTGIYMNNPVWYSYILSEAEKENKAEEIIREVVEENISASTPPANEIQASSTTEESIIKPEIQDDEKAEEDIIDQQKEEENEIPAEPVEKKENETSGNVTLAGDNDQENASDPKEGIISIQPLHVIDFFAAQGIKLKEEDLQDDNLSRQVRSFTGWLKKMKRIHPYSPADRIELNEAVIQKIADKSNQSTDVITETMANILVKQGKPQSAINLYQKLSLTNPSKSTYFAAKIEKLKTT